MLEGIEIELALGDKLKAKGEFGRSDRDVIQHLQGLTPIPPGTVEQQQKFIKNVFNIYFDRNHVVRGNLFFMDAIPEVREWINKNNPEGNY